MARLPDKVRVEIIGQGSAASLDNFTSFQITNDITSPSEGAFELGNDTTWADLQPYIAHGTQYRVFVNNSLRLTGRVELDDIPCDATGGAVVRFTVRTKLADAQYAAADQGVRVKNTSIADFLKALYAPLGYSDADFVFAPYTARDLMTGGNTSGQGSPVEVDLEPLKTDAARVQAGETIYQAADRHLRRHGLMHWDSPDGKIVVSSPNDEQDPIYWVIANRYDPQFNNVERFTRAMDYSGIPSTLAVFGVGGKAGRARVRVGAFAADFDVQDAGFVRPVLIVSQGIRTLNLADRAAARELSARSKRKDCFEVLADGLSYWNGSDSVPWAIDHTCAVSSDVAGGDLGAYYIHRVVLRRTAGEGDATNLNILRRGIWKL